MGFIEKIWELANEDIQNCIQKKEKYLQTQNGPGHPPIFDRKIEKSLHNQEKGKKNLGSAELHQQQAKRRDHSGREFFRNQGEGDV